MVEHRLDPLLKPKYIAVLGASKRPDSVGFMMLQQIKLGGFSGGLVGINPKHEEIEGIACVASIDACPMPPEHVIFCINDARLEDEFKKAIQAGMKAATLVSGVMLEDDCQPNLKARITKLANDAGVLICGGNGMGFYNFTDNIRVCGYKTRTDHKAGGITLITHSGSVFNAIVDSDSRLDYGLVVSAGQELNTGIADYLDYAVEQPTTRVVGLFMETARNPDLFVAALEKAKEKNIPVIALKVGRTEKAARMAASHSGALVGNDAAYQALFDKYGVQRVDTIDELAYALLMFNLCHPIGGGALATIHDSGGERELIIDLADSYSVPFAEISNATRVKLKSRLHPMLPAENPLDAWNDPSDFFATYPACLQDLMDDDATAIGAIIGDKAPHGTVFPEYLTFAKEISTKSSKPVCVIANHQGTSKCDIPIEGKEAGIPIFDNVVAFLKTAKMLMDYRDFQKRSSNVKPNTNRTLQRAWQEKIAAMTEFDEHSAGLMFNDFNIPATPGTIAENCADALDAAKTFGYPVVLKTAMSGIIHKSDVGGVKLNLSDAKAVEDAYHKMASALGPRVLICPMIETDGVELILGMVKDPQFGPIVMIGSGGIHAEILKDVKCAIPPFDADYARLLVDQLKLRPLLDGVRGAKPVDMDSLCHIIANFSEMVYALKDDLQEVDINPLLAKTKGAIALDGLVLRDMVLS